MSGQERDPAGPGAPTRWLKEGATWKAFMRLVQLSQLSGGSQDMARRGQVFMEGNHLQQEMVLWR